MSTDVEERIAHLEAGREDDGNNPHYHEAIDYIEELKELARLVGAQRDEAMKEAEKWRKGEADADEMTRAVEEERNTLKKELEYQALNHASATYDVDERNTGAEVFAEIIREVLLFHRSVDGMGGKCGEVARLVRDVAKQSEMQAEMLRNLRELAPDDPKAYRWCSECYRFIRVEPKCGGYSCIECGEYTYKNFIYPFELRHILYPDAEPLKRSE